MYGSNGCTGAVVVQLAVLQELFGCTCCTVAVEVKANNGCNRLH